MHSAAIEGHFAVAKLLLEEGANPNSTNKEGKTPIHSAAFMGRDVVVALLIKKGSDVNAIDYEGDTPLHSTTGMSWDAGQGSANAAEILIEHNANLSAINKEGYTPLQTAVILHCAGIVKVLVENGADVNFLTDWGQSALDLSRMGGCPDITNFLEQHGAQQGKVREYYEAELSGKVAATMAIKELTRMSEKLTKESDKSDKSWGRFWKELKGLKEGSPHIAVPRGRELQHAIIESVIPIPDIMADQAKRCTICRMEFGGLFAKNLQPFLVVVDPEIQLSFQESQYVVVCNKCVDLFEIGK